MMRKHFLTFLVTFLLTATMSFAQDELFKVLASKGAKVSHGTEWKSVKIGEKLFRGQKLSLAEGTYLGLASSRSGKTIELKKPGTYDVDKLIGEIAAQNASVGKKYVAFVAGEMTQDNEDMAKNRHKYMDVTGSVTRGIEYIDVLAPEKAFYLKTPVTVRWMKEKNTKNYVVTVKNMFDEVMFNKVTSDTSVVVDFKDGDDKQVYILTVASREKPELKPNEYSLRHLTAEHTAAVNKELPQMQAEYAEPTALNKMVMASYYEDKGLLLNAVECYEEAIKLEPEVEDFKKAYEDFLKRYNLVSQKDKK